MQISEKTSSIEDEIINEERVKQCLRKMKIKKAAGPDGIKPEFYKTLESDALIKTLVEALQNIIQMGIIPDGWSE